MRWGPGWTRENQIRWVETRLGEQRSNDRAIARGEKPPYRLPVGVRDRIALEVWLAKTRDGKSWQQIVLQFYPEYRKSGSIKSAGISAARRAFNSVENAATLRETFKRQMEDRIRAVFGCSPRDFKRYLASISFNTRK